MPDECHKIANRDQLPIENTEEILREAAHNRYEHYSFKNKLIFCFMPQASKFAKKTAAQEFVGYLMLFVCIAFLAAFGFAVWATNGIFLLAFKGLITFVAFGVSCLVYLWFKMKWTQLRFSSYAKRLLKPDHQKPSDS